MSLVHFHRVCHIALRLSQGAPRSCKEDVTHARVPRVIVFRIFSGGVAESEQDN